ncbi:caspase family protein, partial [Bacteroidia bacterium]|nr:caspase family protein [Bacteroidia bacterium]
GTKILTVPTNGPKIFTGSYDNTARVWESSSGKLIHSLEGHTSEVYSAVFSPDGTKILTASGDGSTIVWGSSSGKQLIQHFQFDSDPNKWIDLHPSGLFDASPEAMDMMYWTKGLEVIEFSQLKDRYWLPGLWEKVISGKPLPDVKDMQNFKLYPEIKVKEMQNGKIPIELTKREGGYGAVRILLNGKEISQDARGAKFDSSKTQQTLYVDISNHPFLKDGKNKITAIAASENGINSRGVQGVILITKKEEKKPQFFAVVVGVGEYANENINLKYSVADAEAISTALKLGAEGLFPQRNYIYTLTTQDNMRPTKENIRGVFKEISTKASSEDIILLYLAGHGMTSGGDDSDFYFLTADAMSANKDAYQDEEIRNASAISTNEWVKWIKEIPALKQVMIIDACGSGKAVDNLITMRDVEPSQIKAIDRMKDRTGMFIISGCAADAVSYEASQYGQGLLTYSVLQGMKGAALKENKYIDVETIMNFARESVPKLAAGIGGIQTPQLLKPKSGSFDIGILDKDDMVAIPLANPKTVYVRSSFVDSEEFEDVLNLSELLDDKLIQISSRGDKAEYVFFDIRKFPMACKLSGGYQNQNGKITLSLKIRCGEILKEHQLEAKTAEELIEKIVVLLDS